MAPPPPPPDLRVLYRKLASIAPEQLPQALPVLTRQAARCGRVLSTTHEDGSDTALLIHRIKTRVGTLLAGRGPPGRFAAAALVKTLVEAGGWETLRGAEPWARGLLAMMQRGDPLPSKELAVVALARIYILLHPYPTLVREIATPTIPAFATACLQLIKPASSAQTSSPPAIMETICVAMTTLIPLYPTTFRPFASQIRSAVRGSLAPTLTDDTIVSQAQQRAASRLLVSLHHVVAKQGGGGEWAKAVDAVLRDLHATADQVFRAVDESWQPYDGQVRPTISPDGNPSGPASASTSSSPPDQLPPWTGVSAGAQRLVGLFAHLGDYLSAPTSGPVVIPLGALLSAVSRICLIAKLSPKSQSWDQAVETKPAIGRDEKDELWSLMPEMHVAAMELSLVMLQRLDRGMLPLISELSDHLVRIFKSGMDVPEVRTVGYLVLERILHLAGPTMSKSTTALFEPLVAACCRDLQQDAGFLHPSVAPTPSAKDRKNGGKGGNLANADLFLPPSASSSSSSPSSSSSSAAHQGAAATALLPIIFSHLPQEHLPTALRGLLDKTAIVTRSRAGMLASVLHPYRDHRGRLFPSILPYLTEQFPRDPGLEMLRTNLRVGNGISEGGGGGGGSVLASVEIGMDREREEGLDEEMGSDEADEPVSSHQSASAQDSSISQAMDVDTKSNAITNIVNNDKNHMDDQSAIKSTNPFAQIQHHVPGKLALHQNGSAPSPKPKRKHHIDNNKSNSNNSNDSDEGDEEEDAHLPPSKRQEVAKRSVPPLANNNNVVNEEESDDGDDVSVHLDMALDDDDDEEMRD